MNGDTFGNVTATVVNGDVVRVETTASATAGGTAATTLSIGSLSASFHVTTAAQAVPNLQFSIASLPFGSVVTGANRSRVLTVSNSGNGVLSNIAIDMPAGQGFSIAGNTCGSTLAAGQSCSITLVFSPLATGAQTTALSLSSNAPGSPHVLPLSGSGITAAPLAEALDAPNQFFSSGGDAPWFGQTAVAFAGGSAAQSGALAAYQSSFMETTLTGPGEGSFYWKTSSELSYDFLSFSVDGVQVEAISGAVDWTQKKFAVGAGSHVLRWSYTKDQFYSSGADAAWVDKFSFATGQAALSPDSASLNFGSVFVGASATRNLLLTNSGNGVLLPSGISFSGEGFSLTADTCSGATIAPGGSCSLSVLYAPTLPSSGGGNLSITSNAAVSPLSIPLQALGLALSDPGTALDNTALSFSTNPQAPWFAQAGVVRVAGNTTLQSGQAGKLDSSWLETIVTGPGTLSFYWKVSSAGTADSLVVMVDGQIAESISGENAWELRSLDVGAGSHVIRWAYVKTSRYPNGEDAAWLDQISFTVNAAPDNLAEALNTPALGWQSATVPGNNGAWVGVNASNHSGATVPMVASPKIDPNQSSVLRTMLTGPGTLSFWWKVNSSANHGTLCIKVDPAATTTTCISGTRSWAQRSVTIPAGLWPVEFSYNRDGASPKGSDRGWIDEVSYVRSDIPLTTALDGLVFETVPTVPWYGESGVVAVGTSAAQTPPVLDNQGSWIKTQVTGPGRLAFRWKVSSEADFDFLRFYVDGVASPSVAGISGEAGWLQAYADIPAGSLSVGWEYAKDNYTGGGSDTAWLDGVSFSPLLPPDAPTDVIAVAGNAQAVVSFSAPANNGGAAITGYTVTASPGGLSANGGASTLTVSGLTNGSTYSFTVTATNIAGTGPSSAASNSVIPLGGQSISFGAAPSLLYGGTATVSATASSGLPVSFSSLSPGVCSVDGSSVNALTLGTCSIAANQGGNGYYSAAPQVTQTIAVGMGSQSISVGTPAPASATYLSQFTVAATASGGTVTYSSGSPSICANNGATFTMSAAVGSCVVQYNQAGNANYSAASQVSSTTTALQASQSIRFTMPSTLLVGDILALSASGGASGNPILFSTTTPEICGVLGSSLRGLSFGTCLLVADQAGNANYTAAPQVSLSIAVAQNFIVLKAGWNLIGNSGATPWDVQVLFGDVDKVLSVFKWLSGSMPGWAFYTPTQLDGGAAYAHDKGYELLGVVNGGEGVWVNAKVDFTLALGSLGTPVTSADLRDGGGKPVSSGWSLIAVGDNPSPRDFANAISLNPPAAGKPAAESLKTLWAWSTGDGTISPAWYFYAPGLDNDGSLDSYSGSHGYLNFMTTGKLLDSSTGFWVNHP